MYKKNLISIVLLIGVVSRAQSLEPKFFGLVERQMEESRIEKEIKGNLDWHNIDPRQLDGVADSERWLYGDKNQSILLSRKTRERFGIFEAFNEKNQKVHEIRFHKKAALTHRFLTYSVECFPPAISVKKYASDYVLYEGICAKKKMEGQPSRETLTPYLFDRSSQNLYVLDAFDFKSHPQFSIEHKGNKYQYQVSYTQDGKNQIDKRTFSIQKNAKGEWIVKEPAVDNDQSGALNPVEALPKLPIDPKYNLPNVINWDE